MLTKTQIFRKVSKPEIEVHHEITNKEYEIAIEQGGMFLRISLDNLESILKVARRNLKELSQKDKGCKL